MYNPGTAFDSLNAGETRQVTFTYTAKDVQGAVSAPATVTITINGENDAPTGADKTVSLNEDGSRTFTLPTSVSPTRTPVMRSRPSASTTCPPPAA